jgi:hypothetical protein
MTSSGNRFGPFVFIFLLIFVLPDILNSDCEVLIDRSSCCWHTPYIVL